ncbi:MAG: hypothetical protein BGO82_11765 [Devosia sp. 67-54]|uniref:outer membrane protein n=1 Tax=unclassified Devosia TaxID=196773 RepID=UPI00086BD16A|nr:MULTISPECIES: outer membrane beta-barrel protein [unclassified Devosia]MBN9304681.1 outer membrane beta-barrel protein [Devosia sp.]ODU62257.1 MAG: hypothetical protein ABS99_01090 [Acetobacteraceae bacterium SCN 69-10]OJX15340.1 MAG: hypothetical protein BGO82_11765 [Devosia sp. 67-54]
MHKMIVGPLAATLLCAGAAPALAQSAGDWGGTWSGFYAGIYGGYALDTDAASSQHLGPFGNGDVTYQMDSSTSRISTLFGGATAGYNAQIGKVVLGVESDVSVGGFSKSSTGTLTMSGTAGDDDHAVSISVESVSSYSLGPMASFRGRLGVEAPQGVLFYLTGGLVVADRTVASTMTISTTGLDDEDSYPSGTSTSSTQQLVMGPTIGVGVESMVAEHISLGAEYAYVALPEAAAAGGGIDLFGLGSDDSPASFAGGFHSLKAALKYHF